MTDNNEALWRKRFQLFSAVRLIGLLTVLLGVAIALTDLLRPGGWPLIGGVLIAVGFIDALIVPSLLRKMWEREDR
ncbi:hypothetical protein [Sphingomonas xanthus]|uniref:Uncharacterized protein n=1 Tax=Sphingomonas xanthus TaxID=2594473 RepID=A0A516ISL4_9SPHN|nr:hypothetical protein [Sphingomonas xanthus]QDP19814.1 hypothetical protein FMM02_07505 [Sphingomonas xanthus]